MTSTVRRVGAAGLALGLCLGAASTIPAMATFIPGDTPGPPGNDPVPAVGGLLGSVDGGLLGGLVGGLLHGEGGIFGHEGGVIAGDDQLGDVVGGLADSGDDGVVGGGLEVVGAVGDVLADPNIGGEGSFGGPSVGGGVLGGVLGGLLSGGTCRPPSGGRQRRVRRPSRCCAGQFSTELRAKRGSCPL